MTASQNPEALPRPKALLDREQAAAWAAEHRRAGRRVVFTNGCFDLIHPGHVLYLEDARRLGDALLVGLNSDESVRRLKGASRPFLDEVARATVLAALRSVDALCVFPEDTPLALIEAISPQILVKGGDWKPEQVVGREVVLASGGEVKVLAFHPGFSTTDLARRAAQAALDRRQGGH